MKTKAFQTKKRPMKGVRTLYAKTRKRKQRVAAAAGGDFAVEEPNLGVARALVVILILHVVAIIAIVVQSSTRANDVQLAVKDSPAVKPSDKANLVTKTRQAAQPKIGPSDRYEYVAQGDTYERFARRHQVDVQELRRMNNNTPLKYGLALIVPQAVQPAQNQFPNAMAHVTPQDPLIQEALPPIIEVPVRGGLPAEYEIIEAAQPIVQNLQQPSTRIAEPFPEMVPLTAPDPVPTVEVSAPVVQRSAPAPEPQIVQEVAPKPVPAPKPSMKSYTIRRGDTLWAIANRNGISVDKLMSANRSINPKKMKPGISVNIPAR